MEERIRRIYRSNKSEFERHCYMFAVKAIDAPETLAKVLTEGIHHFEVKKIKGYVEVKAVLNNQINKVTKQEEKKTWQ